MSSLALISRITNNAEVSADVQGEVILNTYHVRVGIKSDGPNSLRMHNCTYRVTTLDSTPEMERN